MINQKQIQLEVENLNSLKVLIETYEEIAALRMRKIRKTVLQSRDFNRGLNEVFHQLKISYQNQIKSLITNKKVKDIEKLSFIKRNGKTIYVFLSANTRLYGNIVQETFFKLKEYLDHTPADVAIIGRLGRKQFETTYPGVPFHFFEFPDTQVEKVQLQNLIQTLIQYEKILIFYGRFETISQQKPSILDVYGEEAFEAKRTKTTDVKYLFEPSLQDIMVFFEKEIFASIVEQTLRESELAKFAARMIELDTASENIKTDLSKVNLLSRINKHRAENKKQQEAAISISFFNK
jgi:F-type H+-transporting ATPase subunit gamma